MPITAQAATAASQRSDARSTRKTTAARKPRPKRAATGDRDHLSTYFRDMACIAVLRPEQELAAAKEIEKTEIECWEILLRFAPVTTLICRRISSVVALLPDRPSLRDLATLQNVAQANAEPHRGRAIVRAARKLAAIDSDRTLLTAARKAVANVPLSTPTRAWLRRVDHAQKAASIARHNFVTANLRLVVSIARRFHHSRIALADLIQEGNLGLIKAVERYDYRRGFRFSTYASWWIRHAISRAIADKGREIRLPVHVVDASHRMAKARRQLTAALGRQPTGEEIAAATGWPIDKVDMLRAWHVEQPMAIDTPTHGEGLALAEILEDPNTASPFADLVRDACTTGVRDLLGQITPIEAEILRQRFGFVSEELTLQEVGAKVSLSRERVRQLQEQALSKMRRALALTDLPPKLGVAPRAGT